MVGAQRAPVAGKQQPNQGQVVQIRFRVLNHVSEDGSRPIYDLMNPVILYKDEAIVEDDDDDEDDNKPKTPLKKENPSQLVEEKKLFLDYVNELLENSTRIHEITRRESDAYEVLNEQAYLDKSCSQVVSRITHRSRKGKRKTCLSIGRMTKTSTSHV